MPKQSDYDGAWKEALQAYFPGFMGLFWPDIHACVDWSHQPLFLDKELQQLMRMTKRGRMHVDMLVQLRLVGGQGILVLIHTEVQAAPEADFQKRMFRYHVRLREKHPEHPLISLAVLTYRREGPDFERYAYEAWGCALSFTFPVINLEGWRSRTDELLLLAPHNPFSVVILAQLQANDTRPDKHRLVRKAELVRHLYQWKFGRDEIVRLFRIIDAMLSLPESLEWQFLEAVAQIEEVHEMTYVTSVERLLLKRERQQGVLEGQQKGLQKGLQKGAAEILAAQITRKFGPMPDWARMRMVEADETTLTRWALQVLDAQRVEDVFA